MTTVYHTVSTLVHPEPVIDTVYYTLHIIITLPVDL